MSEPVGRDPRHGHEDPEIDRRRRAAVGRAITEDYRRIPQGDDDLSWPDRKTAEMIAEEPW